MKREIISIYVPVECRVLIALSISTVTRKMSLVWSVHPHAGRFFVLMSFFLYAYTLIIWYWCQRASNCGRPWISTRYVVAMDASDQLIALICVEISALENGRTSA